MPAAEARNRQAQSGDLPDAAPVGPTSERGQAPLQRILVVEDDPDLCALLCDLLNTQGDTLADLAEVLTLAHRPAEAVSALQAAAERFERKGNRVSLERARELGAERMEWEAEPNSVGFYEKLGARRLHDSAPTEWGRVVPVMGVDIGAAPEG